jgi:hypothetical protein
MAQSNLTGKSIKQLTSKVENFNLLLQDNALGPQPTIICLTQMSKQVKASGKMAEIPMRTRAVMGYFNKLIQLQLLVNLK